MNRLRAWLAGVISPATHCRLTIREITPREKAELHGIFDDVDSVFDRVDGLFKSMGTKKQATR